MSKLTLYDFRCRTCNHVFDTLVQPDIRSAECPECGNDSKRLISAPRLDPAMGLDPAFSTMSDKWARKHRQRRKIEDDKAFSHEGPAAFE